MTKTFFAGIMLAPGSLFGNLIGGFVVKKLKLTKKGMARMVVVLKPFSLVFIIMFFFIGCDNRDIAGITVNYPTSNRSVKYWTFIILYLRRVGEITSSAVHENSFSQKPGHFVFLNLPA